MPALRAIVSGYQSLRRLTPEERALLGPVLRYAAARADARWLLGSAGGEGTPCLAAAAALSPDELRAAAG
jgi:Ser/Thr protein kinase RdoA (MazF antagonist)